MQTRPDVAYTAAKPPPRSLQLQKNNTPSGAAKRRAMMGRSVATTGAGVPTPRMALDSSTLNAGSSVFTVCVRLMATAANDRLAAMWPTACMDAGPSSAPNSSLLIGCAALPPHQTRVLAGGAHTHSFVLAQHCCSKALPTPDPLHKARVVLHPSSSTQPWERPRGRAAGRARPKEAFLAPSR